MAESESDLHSKKETQFKCELCKIAQFFCDKSALNKHYRRRHKNKLSKCRFCQKLFFPIDKHEKRCIYKSKNANKNNQNNEKVDKLADAPKNKNNDNNFIQISTNTICLNNSSFENKTNMTLNDIFNLICHYNIRNINGLYMEFSDMIIGQGSYGKVSFGLRSKPLQLVAIKSFHKKHQKNLSFEKEKCFLGMLKNSLLFPKLIEKIISYNNCYIIQELQGPDLSKYLDFSGQKNIITGLRVGIELIINIKILHSYGLIHGDLKEDNIVKLIKSIYIENEEIHFSLIDFGFSQIYLDNNKNHIKKNYKYCGNYYYSSYNALSNGLISRKDDLISICYLILKISGVKLPWDSINLAKPGADTGIRYRIEIESCKKNLNYDFIGKELTCIKYILEDIEKLNFDEPPKYDKYVSIIKEEIKKKKFDSMKSVFIWDEKLKNITQKNDGLNNLNKESEKINILFKGYPKEIRKLLFI